MGVYALCLSRIPQVRRIPIGKVHRRARDCIRIGTALSLIIITRRNLNGITVDICYYNNTHTALVHVLCVCVVYSRVMCITRACVSVFPRPINNARS